MFVDAIQKIKHFRHYTLCPYDTEPETETHLAMKALIKQLYPNAELEVRIGNRITDALVGDVAIECQVSPISEQEIFERTRDYNLQGKAVCWLLGNRDYDGIELEREVYLTSFERCISRLYGGKIYSFERAMNSKEDTVVVLDIEKRTKRLATFIPMRYIKPKEDKFKFNVDFVAFRYEDEWRRYYEWKSPVVYCGNGEYAKKTRQGDFIDGAPRKLKITNIW